MCEDLAVYGPEPLAYNTAHSVNKATLYISAYVVYKCSKTIQKARADLYSCAY